MKTKLIIKWSPEYKAAEYCGVVGDTHDAAYEIALRRAATRGIPFSILSSIDLHTLPPLEQDSVKRDWGDIVAETPAYSGGYAGIYGGGYP